MFVTIENNAINYLCHTKQELIEIAKKIGTTIAKIMIDYSIVEIENCDNFNEIYKVLDGEVVRKTEADFYPENLQKAKQKKLAEQDAFLDKIVMKINGIPVWFNDELVGSLKKTADNLTTIGHTTFPLILKEEMLFLPDGVQRTHILNTVFRIELNAFKTCLLQMDIYSQLVLLSEVTHKNKIKSCTTIDELEAHDFTTGYPEALSLNVEFI